MAAGQCSVQNYKPVTKFTDIFSIAVLGHCLRVTPSAYGKSTNALRNSCRLVIGGLPTNRELKAMDLNFLFSDAKAAAVNIPRTLSNYRTKPYAHVTFKCIDDLIAAKAMVFSFHGKILTWYKPEDTR